MNYNDYKESRDLTWQLLIDNNITELPVKVVALCKELGIEVKYYTPRDGNDGECIIAGGVPYIMVNKNSSAQRNRFTIAHELGHVLLGHVGEYQLVNREPSLADNPIEQAANVFASRLLAPACVLWGCKVKTSADIVRLCDISEQAAEYRMKRMNELYRRNRFLTSPLEKQVFNQFRRFILSHQH